MCGAFLAIATGDTTAGKRRQVSLQSAYHLGRLLTYTLLGAAAGAAGGMLNLATTLAGLRPIAAALAGGMMIVFALIALLRHQGVHIDRLPLPAFWTNLLHRGHRAAMNRPPRLRAFSIGLLTTLLPCGWLYAFAITAAGTASPFLGALAMAVFWAGTLPALIAVGAGLRAFLGPIGRKAPILTCIALLAAGLFTLSGRLLLDPATLLARIHPQHVQGTTSVPSPKAPCHDAN